jgi:S-ribosylhomocysteine lyase
MKTYNVESFNLDHTKVEAPYVRIASQQQFTPKESNFEFIVSKFDVRFSQPNKECLPTATIHSLEHLIAENIRKYSPDVIDFSPMGCRTGFYLILNGDYTPREVCSLILITLRDVIAAEEVPACSEVQCGNYRDHDLEGAKKAAQQFLEYSSEFLLQVYTK